MLFQHETLHLILYSPIIQFKQMLSVLVKHHCHALPHNKKNVDEAHHKMDIFIY